MGKNTDPFTGGGANNAIGEQFSGTSVAYLYQALLGLEQTTRFTSGFGYPQRGYYWLTPVRWRRNVP